MYLKVNTKPQYFCYQNSLSPVVVNNLPVFFYRSGTNKTDAKHPCGKDINKITPTSIEVLVKVIYFLPDHFTYVLVRVLRVYLYKYHNVLSLSIERVNVRMLL